MVRLIINADDLGYAKVNNDAIFSLMEMGKITSATLMTNADGFDDAVERLKNFPQCSFGLHLDLVEFDYISNDKELIRQGLIDENHHVVSNVRRRFIIPNRAFLDAIFREWSLQMEKALDAKVPISHIDSHKHSHTVRYFDDILIKLSQKYNIKKVRNKNQNFRYMSDRPFVRMLWRDLKRRAWCNKISKYCITPDHFDEAISGIKHLENHLIEEDISIEWMCHPGAKSFPHDFNLLADNWEKKLKTPVKLISFNEL